MYCDDTGSLPVGSDSLSRLWESNPILLDWHTSDHYLGDLGCGLLKEVWEECILQRVLYGMERRPYVWGDVLQKIPLLLEGLLQSRIGGLRVLACHRRFPPLYPFGQPLILRRLHPHKSPQIPDACHDLQT